MPNGTLQHPHHLTLERHAPTMNVGMRRPRGQRGQRGGLEALDPHGSRLASTSRASTGTSRKDSGNTASSVAFCNASPPRRLHRVIETFPIDVYVAWLLPRARPASLALASASHVAHVARWFRASARTVYFAADFTSAFPQSIRLDSPLLKHGVRGGSPGRRFAFTSAWVRSSVNVQNTTRERGDRMAIPAIRSLQGVSLEEALRYLDTAEGDELTAAFELARDRNHLDGSNAEPDDAEVHHALFLLRRARGLDAPSFDTMRVQLRRLHAA
jgi:hypothetical protein